MNEIELEEFIAEMEQRLKRFKHYWEVENKQDQKLFPKSMLAGDWDEQFMLFDEDWDNEAEEEQAL